MQRSNAVLILVNFKMFPYSYSGFLELDASATRTRNLGYVLVFVLTISK